MFSKIRLYFKNKRSYMETSEVLVPHYLRALNEIDVKEIAGNAHNPRILEYHKYTTLKATTDEISWCASFVNFCLDGKGNGSAAARDFLNWGRPVKDPQKGDVVVFWRESKSGWKGHVGFFVEQDKNDILVLGGNQGNAVCFKHYPKKQLLGYRRLIA